MARTMARRLDTLDAVEPKMFMLADHQPQVVVKTLYQVYHTPFHGSMIQLHSAICACTAARACVSRSRLRQSRYLQRRVQGCIPHTRVIAFTHVVLIVTPFMQEHIWHFRESQGHLRHTWRWIASPDQQALQVMVIPSTILRVNDAAAAPCTRPLTAHLVT